MSELPRFEWIDEKTGLHCPSLVCVADCGDDTIEIKNMPVLRVRQLLSFDEMYLTNGKLDRRKLPRIAGFRPQASQRFIVPWNQTLEDPWYALVVTYVPDV